jgi:hypothetical protein
MEHAASLLFSLQPCIELAIGVGEMALYVIEIGVPQLQTLQRGGAHEDGLGSVARDVQVAAHLAMRRQTGSAHAREILEGHALEVHGEVGHVLFFGLVVGAVPGAFEAAAVDLGDRLGWYRALADSPATPPQLAERTGSDRRYAREWLEQQAVAGYLTVDDVRAVLRILIVFALVTPFWSLFDQKASTWIIQGNAMRMPHEAWWWPSWLVKSPAQMQALNPIMVMLLIPFNNLVLYPALRRLGIDVTALRRMGFGIAFSGLAWIVAGMIQLQIDGGDPVSIAWQTLPYLLLTFGEVLVSATGLEFAYSQAPPSMKGAIMSLWLLSVSYGNLWVLMTNAAVRNDAVTGQIAQTGIGETAFLMFFFAAFAFAASLLFALYARIYPMQDHYRK